MTTTVKIEAHCASNYEVVIETYDGGNRAPDVVIQDGEKAEVYAYDARKIVVREREKGSELQSTLQPS